jgi:two-component sensor histidine kinase
VPEARQPDALLLFSELISNALQHGSSEGDQVDVAWTLRGDLLEVAVLDCARAATAPTSLTPSEERPAGRGLQIVDRLAEWWGDRIVGGRREVAFRLRL